MNRYPRWAAISYSALLFGAAHLNVYQFILAFWIGLLLGWLFERSRSLLPCIALHAAFNTVVVVLEQGEADASTWLMALVAAVAGAAILRWAFTAPSRAQRERRPATSASADQP